jgi:hypothetical protein
MIFVVFVPMAQVFIAETFVVSQDLVNDSNATVNNLQNPELKQSVQNVFQEQEDSYTFQIDVLGSLNQYAAWIIIIILAIVLILLSRALVARQRGVAF